MWFGLSKQFSKSYISRSYETIQRYYFLPMLNCLNGTWKGSVPENSNQYSAHNYLQLTNLLIVSRKVNQTCLQKFIKNYSNSTPDDSIVVKTALICTENMTGLCYWWGRQCKTTVKKKIHYFIYTVVTLIWEKHSNKCNINERIRTTYVEWYKDAKEKKEWQKEMDEGTCSISLSTGPFLLRSEAILSILDIKLSSFRTLKI